MKCIDPFSKIFPHLGGGGSATWIKDVRDFMKCIDPLSKNFPYSGGGIGWWGGGFSTTWIKDAWNFMKCIDPLSKEKKSLFQLFCHLDQRCVKFHEMHRPTFQFFLYSRGERGLGGVGSNTHVRPPPLGWGQVGVVGHDTCCSVFHMKLFQLEHKMSERYSVPTYLFFHKLLCLTSFYELFRKM